jgi:subtilisin family serine protease
LDLTPRSTPPASLFGNSRLALLVAGPLLGLGLSSGCSSQPGDSAKLRATESALSAPSVAPAPAQGSSRSIVRGPAGSFGVATGGSAAPTQLIVKFKSDGPTAVTQCPERWLAEHRSFVGATADASNTLDTVMRSTGVKRAHALIPGRTGLSTANAKLLFQNRLSAARARNPARSARALAGSAPLAGRRGDLTNVYTVELAANIDADAAARAFGADPHVEYAQVNGRATAIFTPNDPFFASTGSWGQSVDDLWNLKKIGMPSAWDKSQGKGVVVAVVDTGLDLTHPDIVANIWRNSDEIAGNGIDDDHNGFIDDVQGWDFAGNSANPSDQFGHGTHVSGTIAALGNNGQGVIGVAPQAQIMPVRSLDAAGSGTFDELAQGIIYAAQNGAEVINNSWGCSTPCPSNPVVEDAVAMAHNLGVVVVFAAGNSNDDVANYSPQNQPDVIVVSASDPSDQREFFSNFGLLDVAAPGGGPNVTPPTFDPFRNILSLKASQCAAEICPPELVVGTQYLRQAGTSMSAPHVAGLAAVLLGQTPNLSPEEVRQVIRHSSDDAGAVGVDTDSGYGRINAARAVLEPRPLAALITSPTTPLIAVAQVDVLGTAAGTGFASFRLEDGIGASPTSFSLISSSMTAVSNARLGTWNSSQVAEGLHTLRVVATTSDGRSYEDRQLVTVQNVVITSPPSEPLAFSRADAPISVLGTVAPANFLNYSLGVLKSDGTNLDGAKVTLTGGGQRPVVNGVLATWDASGVPADEYSFVLTVTTRSTAGVIGVLGQTAHMVVDPTLHTGWPIAIAQQQAVSASISNLVTTADVDRNGTSEIVLGFGSNVRILDHTGAELPGWPQGIDPQQNGVFIQTSPAVGDIDGDGVPEIVAINAAGMVFAWHSNGVALPGWPHATSVGIPTFVAIDDLDGDGRSEIITSGLGVVNVLHGDGSTLPGWPLTIGGSPSNSMGAPAIGDVDGDGKKEIVVASSATPTFVYVLRSTGGILPGWPLAIEAEQNVAASSVPTVGDLDGDGKLEIAIGAVNGSVSVFRGNGSLLSGWPQAIPNVARLYSTPTIGDLDGDGRLDVVAGGSPLIGSSGLESLAVWRGTGALLPGWPTPPDSGDATAFGFGTSALADLDGDNKADVLVSSDSPLSRVINSLQGFRSNGSLLPGFPKVTAAVGAFPTNTPAVADFDGDGKLELAWVDVSGIMYLWDLDAPATARAPWPQFQHDAAHTGRAPASASAAPPAPTGLTATAGNAQVSLSWTASAGATSYNVLRSTTSGTGFTSVATGLTTTSFVNTGLTNGTTFFYVVTATNASGTSANSAQASATPSAGGAPPCSGAITVTGGQSGNFNTSGAVCYRTSDTINGWGCSNFDGRTVSVNGVAETCGKVPLPPKQADGFRYFAISAGTFPWASFFWF